MAPPSLALDVPAVCAPVRPPTPPEPAAGSAPAPRAVDVPPALAAEAAEDGRLVRAARAGDSAAFGTLVRRHLTAAHSAAFAVLGDEHDADDCCQDAFVAALERLDAFEPPEKFRAWLLTVVRNRAIDLRRRQHVRRAEPLEYEDGGAPGAPGALASDAPSPHQLAERADARERIEAALATLTPTRREVALLHDLEGWTHKEIAAHLGVAEGTVRAHLFWARRDLRARLSTELRRGDDHD